VTEQKHSRRAILIVESRALLRHFMVGLVKTAGFEAIEAGNAEEALSILTSNSHIALLITNVITPGVMTGVELAHAVDIRWPSVKVIVVSGKPGLTEAELPRKSLLFAKPYHDEELLFEIRSIISPLPE
jgi:DNA-binding NtrC family response regulator